MVWGKEVSSKEWIIIGEVNFLGKESGLLVDYLTRADQVIPDWLVEGYIPGRGWNYN